MTGKEQRELFFGLLFGEGDCVEIRVRQGDQFRKRVLREVGVENAVVRQEGSQADVFFGVLPRNTEGEPVGPVRYLWADLDDKLGGRGAVISAALPTADIIVDSGNGLHCYWALTKPLEASVEDRTTAAGWKLFQDSLKVFQQHIMPGCDNTSDPARILRVPGTKNYKDPENPKEVRLIYVRGRYQHESLDKV